VSVCYLCEKWRSAWKVAADKNMRFGEYIAVGIGILEGNLNYIFKVIMQTSRKFSTLAAFIL
jgi:homoserine dehydrogenase